MEAPPVRVLFSMMNIRMNSRETELRNFVLEGDSCYLVGEQAAQTDLPRVQSVKKEKYVVLLITCFSNTHRVQYLSNALSLEMLTFLYMKNNLRSMRGSNLFINTVCPQSFDSL